MNKKLTLALAALTLSAATAGAQTIKVAKDYDVQITGSLQTDFLVPQEDNKIGTGTYDDKVLNNTYAEVHALSKYVDAGVRLEYLDHPLPGFDKDFKGWGVPFYYIKGKLKNAELTLGNFYEQFGSGFILRTYEERSLGIDNSLLGGRVMVRPFKGVQAKVIVGTQRRYWDTQSLIGGADLELSVSEWSQKMQQSGTNLTLGASWVVNHQHQKEDVFADAIHKLRFVENTNAFDVRANFQKGGFSVLGEYAQKTEDPTFDGKFPYIYRKGYVTMLSTSYSQSGMSILLQAKRSDNMNFRSCRTETSATASTINHLPAFAMQQTYALASLYSYGTQPNGEWAYQAELGYQFKRKTFLGGKYGTSVKLNFSHIRSIDKKIHDGGKPGTDGYGSPFWKQGDELYYQDINVQLEKKITKDFKLNLMYMNQFYNKTVAEGHGGIIHSDIYIAEAKYRINKKLTLRGEAQYLHTDKDQGDWCFGLLELSFLPHFMFTISDQYNGNEHYYTSLGAEDKSKGTHKEHYINGSVTFTHGAHRLQVGYGKTRAGYNCSGGTVSYNYNF